MEADSYQADDFDFVRENLADTQVAGVVGDALGVVWGALEAAIESLVESLVSLDWLRPHLPACVSLLVSLS